LDGGAYVYTVTDANGCVYTDNFTISPAPLRPNLQIVPDSSVINLGDTITLNAVYSNALNPSFVWSPALGLSCTTCPSPVAQPEETTVYTVNLYINPLNPDCYITTTALVRVTTDIVMPTAFSPNGDGKNDKYYPVFFGTHASVSLLEFRVFNRWGELVYDNPLEGWDGTYKGIPQPVETYVYYVYAEVPDPANSGKTKSIKKEGAFALLR
jgi:gliding motility-associated-like protein